MIKRLLNVLLVAQVVLIVGLLYNFAVYAINLEAWDSIDYIVSLVATLLAGKATVTFVEAFGEK